MLVVVLMVSTARGDEAHGAMTAKQYSDAGATAYNLLRYTEALESYRRAYMLKQVPVLLWNIGQCLKMLGEYEAAAGSYRRYVSHAPPETVEMVRRMIAEMDAAAARKRERELERQRPAPVAVVAAPVPAPAPAAAAPALPVATPTQTLVQLQPIMLSAPVLVREPPPPAYRSTAGWTLLGFGLALGGIGAGLLGYAPSMQSQARMAMTVAEQENDTKLANNLQLSGAIIVGVGGLLTVVSVIPFSVAAYRHEHKR